jgi:hypothetical protein
MVAKHIIDLEDNPNFPEILHDIAGSQRMLVVRENGKEIAEIRPIAETEGRLSLPDRISPKTLEIIRRRRERLPTPQEIEVAKSAAGGWADVDTDTLIRDIYEDRERDTGRNWW